MDKKEPKEEANDEPKAEDISDSALAGMELEHFNAYKSAGIELIKADTPVKEWDWDEFDIRDVAIERSWILAGRKGAGKSTWINNFFYHYGFIFPYGW